MNGGRGEIAPPRTPATAGRDSSISTSWPDWSRRWVEVVDPFVRPYPVGLFVEGLGLHYAAANLLAIAFCSLVNFVINDRLVFEVGRPRSFPRALPCSSDTYE